jgi:hypothetical protein
MLAAPQIASVWRARRPRTSSLLIHSPAVLPCPACFWPYWKQLTHPFKNRKICVASRCHAQKGGPGAESIQLLADEVAAWMGVGGVVTQVCLERWPAWCE